MDEKGKEEKENGEDIEGCAYDPEDKTSPYGAFIQTTRYYNATGEPFRFIDPTQVKSVEVCGVIIPITDS